MAEPNQLPSLLLPTQGADLESVLAAWHEATLRLEKTHEALREEVRRLTDELAAKNRELAHKERLALIGQMASHIAHEVRNSLMPVTLYLSLLRRRLAEDPIGLEMLDKLQAGLRSLQSAVTDLLHFSSDRDPQRRPFLLYRLIEEILSDLAPQLQAQKIRCELDIPKDQVWVADQEMIRRAVMNLVLNSLDAMPEGGVLSISSVAGPEGLELEVADTGPGLSEEARRRATEPFYTTKPDGIGLGLAIVSRIAEAHGGELLLSNCPEGGAAVTLKIPYSQSVLVQEAAA
ncbi:MAG: HAMP domain-containing histidine kinase [Thermoguttaceae bacterium]|nr:HAMP domain-containing histidine kinase [Thermoguttaceae bacterium]MDW8037254.1 HAMP domain-containing sensor histidine kinase [Thermoguttaceae bacterium]